MDRDYTPQQIIGLFNTTSGAVDRQIQQPFTSELEPLCTIRGGQSSTWIHKMYLPIYSFVPEVPLGMEIVVDCVALEGAHDKIIIKEPPIAIAIASCRRIILEALIQWFLTRGRIICLVKIA